MRISFSFFLTGVLLLCLVPFIASTQTAEELRNQIASQNGEIEKLNKEIAAYEKQLVDIGGKKQTLQSTLNSLDISRKQITAKINVTKTKISKIQLEIQNLNGSIANKETSIEKNEDGLAETLNRLRQADEISMVEHVLGTESISALWDDIENNFTFRDAVTKHTEKLANEKTELTVDRDESEKKSQELASEQTKLVSEQKSLDINRREQQALLTQTKNQESTFQKIVADKQAARQQFEQQLNELESRLEYTLDPSRLPSSGKGVLRWPLDKVTVTQYFGNTEFAQSGAYSGKGHNGIDFRASVGTPLKAALSGTIEGTGNSDEVRGCYSYGKWVLIKHTNGLSTLYAHLSNINVVSGQSVKTGEVIGYSGNTGYATGPHLHFGVYASNGVRVMKLGESTGKKTPCANATIPVSPLGAYLNPMDYL